MDNKEEKNLIWDLDGTLLDSYSIILRSLKETLDGFEVNYDKEYILRYIVEYSVDAFIKKVVSETNFSFSQIKERYSRLSDLRSEEISLIRNAKEILEELSKMKVSNYIYTHKGKSTNIVLERLGIKNYFKEIITSENGFERKPSPEAIIYLMNKYNMYEENTFYIGDRSLDVECANNSNIKSILYLDEFSYGKKTGKEDYIVTELKDILKIFCIRQ